MKSDNIALLGGLLVVCSCFNIIGVQAYNIDNTIWWPGSLRNPHYFYISSGWSEFTSAISDWNGKNTDFGDLERRMTPDECPLIIYTYSSSSDGNCGYWTAYGDTGALDSADIFLNNWFLTNGNPAVGLPLDSANKRKSVCAHELGHEFCLNDLTDTTTAVMRTTGSGRLTAQIWTPQNDDVDGVNANTNW